MKIKVSKRLNESRDFVPYPSDIDWYDEPEEPEDTNYYDTNRDKDIDEKDIHTIYTLVDNKTGRKIYTDELSDVVIDIFENKFTDFDIYDRIYGEITHHKLTTPCNNYKCVIKEISHHIHNSDEKADMFDLIDLEESKKSCKKGFPMKEDKDNYNYFITEYNSSETPQFTDERRYDIKGWKPFRSIGYDTYEELTDALDQDIKDYEDFGYSVVQHTNSLYEVWIDDHYSFIVIETPETRYKTFRPNKTATQSVVSKRRFPMKEERTLDDIDADMDDEKEIARQRWERRKNDARSDRDYRAKHDVGRRFKDLDSVDAEMDDEKEFAKKSYGRAKNDARADRDYWAGKRFPMTENSEYNEKLKEGMNLYSQDLKTFVKSIDEEDLRQFCDYLISWLPEHICKKFYKEYFKSED